MNGLPAITTYASASAAHQQNDTAWSQTLHTWPDGHRRLGRDRGGFP
ncbi:hypothetical protein [Dactylosporangium sp. NPDC051484]